MRRICETVVYMLVMLGVFESASAQQPKIAPKADKALKRMCTYLAKLKSFSFEAEATYEDVEDDGLKLQYTDNLKVSIRRPNRVATDRQGDIEDRKSFYNGKTITLYDRKAKTYAVAKAPETIDKTLDHINKTYNYNPPLADLLFSDPYKVLTENVIRGVYVGLHQVGKTKCHHLAFRQTTLDWQVWIDAGKKPLLRKVVITYLREGGQPQFYSRISNWEINPTFNDGSFTFTPPNAVRKIPFVIRGD
ncbi:MAG: DUF2092 domain-containing protein [Gemmataceae bacterium]